MSKLKVELNLDKDFFDVNQEFRIISEFKEFRESNDNASQIMWGIYLSEDLNSGLYLKFRDRLKRRSEIEKNYLNIPDFKWEDYEDLIYTYNELTLSETKKSLKTWKDKIRELDIYMTSLKFGADDDRLFKLIEKAKPFWATIEDIEKKVKAETEGEANTIQGKGNLSLSDKRYK